MPDPDPASSQDAAPDERIRPFFVEPALRGVLISGIGVFATFGTWLVVLALRAQSVIAIGSVAVLVIGSVEGIRIDRGRHGRFGALSVLIATLWLLIGVGSASAVYWEIL